MSNATAFLVVPSAPTVVSVPLFGGFWLTSECRALSMS
jgi:hypothetical protein